LDQANLKNRALTMCEIPERLRLEIEDYFEDEKGNGEAYFSWTSEDEKESIDMTLNQDGGLLSLTLDLKQPKEEQAMLTLEENRAIAEAFLTGHYPDALKILERSNEKELENGAFRFHYEQLVFGLPLDIAGCYLDVANNGTIIHFRYYGIKPVPAIPKQLVAKDVLVEAIRKTLDFDVQLVYLPEGVYESANKGLRLVYEPNPHYLRFRADELIPRIREDDDIEDDVDSSIALAAPEASIIRDLTNEEIIGITSEMEIIREADLGSEIGTVWRDRDWQADSEDLSFKGFFDKRNDGTVKAFIDKETGKVKKFIWFKNRTGDLRLTREECQEKAAAFLQRMIPDYHLYLELLVQEFDHDDDDTEDSHREGFNFMVKSQSGYRVFTETVHITVNRTTGDIDHYMGLSFDINLLKNAPSVPIITKEEAWNSYFEHLDFQLSWQKDYESEQEQQYLEYKACVKNAQTEIRYIDALTGELICSKM
jgi:hypothetical protein